MHELSLLAQYKFRLLFLFMKKKRNLKVRVSSGVRVRNCEDRQRANEKENAKEQARKARDRMRVGRRGRRRGR